MSRLASYVPSLSWARGYRLSLLTDDLLAAVIVAIMLVPQALAYAMLAGLPPQVGLMGAGLAGRVTGGAGVL